MSATRGSTPSIRTPRCTPGRSLAAVCAYDFEDRASAGGADGAGLRAALDYVRQGDVLIAEA